MFKIVRKEEFFYYSFMDRYYKFLKFNTVDEAKKFIRKNLLLFEDSKVSDFYIFEIKKE